ncbi:hypothetical protein [Cerasicoccus frondis]|uniref:hypothetical protein n=1 Tax=Cerasicoccus frondis TaxID=490090 RepID=UPI002852A498|nr:hypothetical protein [Cerasicoccus frondis]
MLSTIGYAGETEDIYTNFFERTPLTDADYKAIANGQKCVIAEYDVENMTLQNALNVLNAASVKAEPTKGIAPMVIQIRRNTDPDSVTQKATQKNTMEIVNRICGQLGYKWTSYQGTIVITYAN